MATVQERTGRTLAQPVLTQVAPVPSGPRPASPGAGGGCCWRC
jgi:hypothetical protein